MEPEIKDFTSTSFGLVIAYLVPGLAGLYTASLYSVAARLHNLLALASTPEGVLIILFVGLMAGTLLNAAHFVTIHLFCNRAFGIGWNMENKLWAKLKSAEILACYVAVVSEYYRAHQFFGTMFILIPFFWFGYGDRSVGFSIWLAVLWIACLFASIISWKYQVEIGSKILT